MELILRERKQGPKAEVRFLGEETAQKTRAFHQSFPQYSQTPLSALPALARELGVGQIFLKDESYRFGLNAFKVLGGSYAIGCDLAERLGVPVQQAPYSVLTGAAGRALGQRTYVTATDGNHGRGVAWTAHALGQRSVVYMPKGSAPERLHNIQAAGAEASITPYNYDGAVRLAWQKAQENGWTMVQDTAWEGYTQIPTHIMQGYTTMVLEAWEQLQAQGKTPTHIFIQAGVGSLAAAVQGFFASVMGEQRPKLVVVEPTRANCLFRTAQANDGQLHFVTDDMATIMAGLACGEPCTIAWQVLNDWADGFLQMEDGYAATGMRVLANPLPGDPCVTAGESGAAGMGALLALLRDPHQAALRQALGLDEHAVVLLFSTEGDTDRANYRRILWDGAYPCPQK